MLATNQIMAIVALVCALAALAISHACVVSCAVGE
jgi:hypothetical protein